VGRALRGACRDTGGEMGSEGRGWVTKGERKGNGAGCSSLASCTAVAFRL